MTKVFVLGQETEKKKGKPIEFVKVVLNSGEIINHRTHVKYDNIMLLYEKLTGMHYDVMFAWNDKEPYNKTVILGYFNDGFIEQDDQDNVIYSVRL